MMLLLGSLSTGLVHATIGMDVAGTNVVQQESVCKGVVTDANGETVIGASVVVKGTTNGTITGLDGDFELQNVKKGATIQISFVGYETKEVVWNGGPLNVELKDDTQVLDEVVVVGFGRQLAASAHGVFAVFVCVIQVGQIDKRTYADGCRHHRACLEESVEFMFLVCFYEIGYDHCGNDEHGVICHLYMVGQYLYGHEKGGHDASGQIFAFVGQDDSGNRGRNVRQNKKFPQVSCRNDDEEI